MKKCLFCNSEFTPANPKGKFCSSKCRVYSNRGQKKADTSKDKVEPPKNKEETVSDTKTIPPVISEQISALEKEMAGLGSGSLANARRKFLQNKIWELKQNI